MLPRLPSSTLFPYTTLFRSSWRGDALIGRLEAVLRDHEIPARLAADEVDPPPGAFHRPRETEATCVHRSEEHTSELQSRPHLVCRLLLEKKKKNTKVTRYRG